MPKVTLERTSSLGSTPRAQAVTPAVTPSGTPAVQRAPTTEYAGQAAPQRELVPRGKQVTTSADPMALWGDAPKSSVPSQEEFAALAPGQQRETIQALRQERQQAAQEIQARLAQLDIKWERSRLVTRTEALREYHEKTKHLDPATKKDLDALLRKSEQAQVKINSLRARIDRLPKTPEAKKQQAELRNQLAKELRRARDEQSKVVKQATAVVDQQGLKVDRLAVTEQVIDPSAPAPGTGQSLLEKVVHFFKLDTFLNWAATAFASLFTDLDKRRDESRAEEADDRRKKLDDRVRTQKREQLQQVEHAREAANVEQAVIEQVRQLLAASNSRA